MFEPVLRAYELRHQGIEIFVMRKQHMPADIPDKAVIILEARGQTADVGLCLTDQKILDPKLGQAMRCRESSGTRAYDQVFERDH